MTNPRRPVPDAIPAMLKCHGGGRRGHGELGELFLEGPEREVKDSLIDTVYQKLLDDLRQYCTEQEIEEKCRAYAEKKKAESTASSGKRRGAANR